MAEDKEAFIGIDVAKLRNAVAIADAGRDGEVRFYGEVDASPDSMRRLAAKLAGKYQRLHFCYEAGPTGYGLHRLLTGLGHSCIVVAPSLIPRKPSDSITARVKRETRLPRQLLATEAVERDDLGTALGHLGLLGRRWAAEERLDLALAGHGLLVGVQLCHLGIGLERELQAELDTRVGEDLDRGERDAQPLDLVVEAQE